jgi:hypothetical protein
LNDKKEVSFMDKKASVELIALGVIAILSLGGIVWTSESDSVTGEATRQPCKDSDGGIKPDVYGSVSGTNVYGQPASAQDSCVYPRIAGMPVVSLEERYCSGYYTIGMTLINCPYGCAGGRCKPAPGCGNGFVDTGETCDPPNGVSCDSKCQKIPFCGDYMVNQPSEQCEPPKTSTCSATCQKIVAVVPAPRCGDGVVNQASEQCEPANTATCSATCQKIVAVVPAPRCGDGVVNQASEQCEPPNTATCRADCQKIGTCGDGIINQATEQCEPPNTATCSATCQKIVKCGDGVVNQLSEQCEPANTATCDAMCQIIRCQDNEGGVFPNKKGTLTFTAVNGQIFYYPDICPADRTKVTEYQCTANGGITSGDVLCPTGTLCTDGACVATAVPAPAPAPAPKCGDGVVNQVSEQCEPPNTATCSATCQKIVVPICGNNLVEAGEACEPPNTATCDSKCQNIVVANQPPAVQVFSPANGKVDTVAAVPYGVTLGASVQDPENSPAKVEFYVNNALVATGTSFSAVGRNTFAAWSAPAAGTYSITAKAFDTAGASTMSAPSTYTIKLAVCGNNIIETGEQCDPPGTSQNCFGLICRSNCMC